MQDRTDIADVLRDYLDGNPDARGLVEFVDASDLRDAAVEIDRLRAAIARWYRAHDADNPATDEEMAAAVRSLEDIANGR